MDSLSQPLAAFQYLFLMLKGLIKLDKSNVPKELFGRMFWVHPLVTKTLQEVDLKCASKQHFGRIVWKSVQNQIFNSLRKKKLQEADSKNVSMWMYFLNQSLAVFCYFILILKRLEKLASGPKKMHPQNSFWMDYLNPFLPLGFHFF